MWDVREGESARRLSPVSGAGGCEAGAEAASEEDTRGHGGEADTGELTIILWSPWCHLRDDQVALMIMTLKW